MTEILRNTPSPRPSNTGAVNTPTDDLKPCVDWIQATLHDVPAEHVITDVLGLGTGDFVDMERGNFGYKACLRSGHISVYYDGAKGMGVHVSMSGQGCREWEFMTGLTINWLIWALVENKATFSRLDLAVDDHKGYFTIKQIKRYVKDRLLQSKFKSAISIEKLSIKDGKTQGETIYFGSESSRIRIRMYDKAAEQEVGGHWVRTEVQFRDERADIIAAKIAEDTPIGTAIKGVLGNYLRFLQKGKGKNRSRWKTAAFWERFLGEVEPIKLYVRKPEATIDNKIVHMYKQYSRTMAMIVIAKEGETTDLHNMINIGAEKLRPKDRALINEYKKRAQGLSTLGLQESPKTQSYL